jgi:DNA polymerase V
MNNAKNLSNCLMNYELSQSPVGLAPEPAVQELRLLSRISAGFPSPATDYVEEGLDLNKYLIDHPAASFLFAVHGESMTGAGIMNGDRVIVDRSRTAHHNDIVVAEIDSEYTLKRLFQRGGRIELRPENANFPAITLEEGDELRIWGVVVGVVRRYT